VHGDAVTLRSADSDATVRALLATQPAARDLEVTGADLEDAFLTLTSGAAR
jgi:ABC-2 type transport system ATP-binding protein